MPSECVFEMVTSDGHTFRIRALTRVQLDNAIEAHGWYPAAPLAASLWAHEGQPAAYYSLAGRGQEVKA